MAIPMLGEALHSIVFSATAKDARTITIIIDSSHSCMTGCFARSDDTAQLGTFCENTVTTPTAAKDARAITRIMDSSHSRMTDCCAFSEYTVELRAISTNARHSRRC